MLFGVLLYLQASSPSRRYPLSMSAFVPKYQHDVFVSYARVDDEPLLPGDESSCWVRTLRQSLQTLLNQRAKGASIWMDIADIACNRQLSSEISGGLSGSATLLVIMSDGYLESEWCRKELAAFVETHGPTSGNGRIFVVHRDEIPFEKWPPQLRELYGYPFYVKDAHTGAAMPLAVPKPDPQEKEYFARLHRLRDQLASQLKKMQAGEAEPTTTPESPSEQPSASGASSSLPEQGQPTVFLAEVTGDLYEYREQLQSYLSQTGLRVLPTQFYPRAPAEFQAELDRDLSQAMLFVQLLGPYPSPRTENLPHGYEGLQAARAAEAGISILQWRTPSLEAASVRDQQHREMVFSDNVLATDLEEFKRIISDTIRKTVLQVERPSASGGESYILLNVAKKDLAIADAIADRLADSDVAFDIVDESTPLVDLAESDDYDGMMVVYGECPQNWVQQQVRQFRRIVLDKKHRAPECAIFVGPPEHKAPLRCRPPRFHVIEDQDQTQLEAYLAALRQRKSNS